MESAFRALVEPRRRAILQLVWNRELAAGAIASHFDVTRPAISQHLNVLKHAGLLTERRQGTRRLYRARPEGLAEVRAFVEKFWDEGLARLKFHAEAEERRVRHDPGRDQRRRPRDPNRRST
jgi:DNA-binding transcriptional ArsR family regulator